MARFKTAATIFLLLIYIIFSSQISSSREKNKSSNTTNTIKVDITTHLGDRQNFREGDTLSFFLSLNLDAYILVIYEDATGQLTQLLPNKFQKNNYYHTGFFIALPNANTPFHFRVQAPFGREIIWVFASDSQTLEINGKLLNNGLKQLKPDISKIRTQVMKNAHSAFGEAKLLIQTEGRVKK